MEKREKNGTVPANVENGKTGQNFNNLYILNKLKHNFPFPALKNELFFSEVLIFTVILL